MNLRQAAQQALEALEKALTAFGPGLTLQQNAITALRAALAEPDYWQEEARRYAGNADYWRKRYKALAEPEQEPVRLQCTTCGTVYADGVPPQVPEQEPQTTHWEGCEAVHPECKTEPLAAWENKYGMKEWQVHAIQAGWMPAPTPRKPLTDEEISVLWDGHTVPVFDKTGINPIVFARAIERAHGIGEQHE